MLFSKNFLILNNLKDLINCDVDVYQTDFDIEKEVYSGRLSYASGLMLEFPVISVKPWKDYRIRIDIGVPSYIREHYREDGLLHCEDCAMQGRCFYDLHFGKLEDSERTYCDWFVAKKD